MRDWGFGDIRLSERAEQIVENIVATGSLVLRRFGGSRAGELAAHRFLDNARTSPKAILDTLSLRTSDAVRGRTILAVQDTTEVNFLGRDAARWGMGQAGGDTSVGFFVHPVIAVDMETEAVLGLVDAEIWTRPQGMKRDPDQLLLQDKESARWLTMMTRAQERLDAATRLIVVGDSESDIYTVFAQRPDDVDFIVRAKHNRKTASGMRVNEAVGTFNFLGHVRVAVAAKPGQKARTAWMTLQAGRLAVTKPKDNKEPDNPSHLDLTYIEADEEKPPKGAKALHWRLVTSLKVERLAQAGEVVRFYRARWRIEEVFRALKTNGLDLEASQIEAGHRLFKLAALGLVAATRIVQLVDARDHSTRPASDVVDPDLYDAIEAIGCPLEGATERQKNPHAKGTLSWLSWIVARLGGWNCYYKPPGPKTMAIGWKQLASMTAGYLIAQESLHKAWKNV